MAANPQVRAELVKRQRRWAPRRGSGGWWRDGTSARWCSPRRRVKVYLTASAEERARRRGRDESADGVARRDRLDSTRSTSPLTRAADAHVLDTTGRSVDDVVEEVLSWL